MDSVVVEPEVEVQEGEEYANIEEAPVVEQPQAEPEMELPDKFKNKSMEDIISSYENLEKELGRKGQEIGELRKLTDGILQQQITTSQSGTEALEEEDIDFFDDPDKAVSKAIENHPKFRQFEEQQKTQHVQVTTQRLKEAHPDYVDIVSDSKFQEWVQESPIRKQLFVAAHNYNLDSALELIGNWKERALISNTSEAEANKAVEREQAMKAGKGVSRTSSESTSGKKIYRRADLIRLKTNDPERYESLQDEILAAYAEGRVK
tara:strand:+ start:4227 stop:5015 length:789 start_codon:yes stop_codon:yes gene_type:complete